MELQQGTIKALSDKNNLYENRIAAIEIENKANKFLNITIKESFKDYSK